MDKPADDRPASAMTGAGAIRLVAASASATLDTERGGRLASWTVDGRELVVGPPDPDDRSIRWGCFLMAPWAGRLADGRFRAGDGRVVRVPRTHGRHAIHGLLWHRAWHVAEASADGAVLTCDISPELWPPGGLVRHEVRLSEDRLDFSATVSAAPSPAGPAPIGMPAALGWHPWFRRDGGRGDPSLRVDAAEVLETVGMIPTRTIAPVSGAIDLRAGPHLGRRRLDHAYVSAGSPAVLRWDDVELEIAWEPSPSTLVVHTPASSICVEPQTAWPNAPALEADGRERSGLRILRAGETLAASMSMTLRRAGS